MNQKLGFETIPFEIDPEFERDFEGEDEWGRRRSFAGGGGAGRYSRRPSSTGLRRHGTKRPPIPRPRPTSVRPRGPRAVVFEPYGLASEPYPGEPEPAGTEHVRWVQGCLNQVMGLQLPLDGIMGPPVRSAIRSFQELHKLPVDGLLGPDTEQALKGACKAESQPTPAAEPTGREPVSDVQSGELPWAPGTEWEFGGVTGMAPKLLKQDSTPLGTTLYVEIDLGIVDHGITAVPMTGIFIPQGFVPGRAVDVILYLHGHKPEKNRQLTIDQYWDRQRFPYGAFREGVNASGRNVILVAPTLGAHSEAGRLVKSGGLDAYLDQVLVALRAHGPQSLKDARPGLGTLILVCHSGGGKPMRRLADGPDRALAGLRECWGFDCTYNKAGGAFKTGDDTFWANWARARPNAKVYIYYIPGSQTAPLSESLRNKGIPNAIVTPSKDGRHNYVPITYWQDRIGGATFLKARSGGSVSPIPTTLFTPTPIESPGGGRVQDKRPPPPSDLVTVSGVGGKKVQLHRLAGQAWQALVKAARSDGIRDPLLLPTSGYRSPAYQGKLWQEAKRKYGSEQEARKWVAPPGSSAHQSGRAIDFHLGGENSSANVARLRSLPAYRWLMANAARFGFYPYEREPWHWEYNPPARGGTKPQPLQTPPITPSPPSAVDVRNMSQAQFIEFVGTNARRSMDETGVPASVTVAQAIIETGWGKHTIGEAKNLFGIKGRGPAGSVRAPTKEYLNGRWVTVNANFAKYDSYEQSITEHARFFLRNRRYARALQFKNDADRFAREIHKAGYATAPDYSDKLIALMRKYNLYRFDRLSPATPTAQA